MNNEPTLNASFEEEKYTKTMIGLNIQGTDSFRGLTHSECVKAKQWMIIGKLLGELSFWNTSNTYEINQKQIYTI